MPKPRRRALTFLDKYEKEGRRTQHKRVSSPKLPEPEIIPPPAHGALIRSALDALSVDAMDTSELDRTLTAAKLPIALQKGGFFDPDPLAEKIDELRRLDEYKVALIRQVTVMRHAMEEVSALKRAQRQQYMDILAFKQEVLEVKAHLKYADVAAARRDEVAEAEARATIARLDGEAEKARRPVVPAPPASTAAAVTPPNDPRAQNKARIMAEIERLEIDEGNEIRRLTKLRPETEWSPDLKDEVVRIQNMYDDAREELRKQLGRYL
ncbi:MAG: hypothetical protein ROO76_07270 [Terriglobia bacterium]|nr:hypothetical protein [Terriglobia bacterium]